MAFEKTFGDIEYADDPMAKLIKDLEELKEYHYGITQLLPRVISTLRMERMQLLRDADKRFSDLWSRIDTFREDDEDSWETAMRILDHYKETYKGQKAK